MMEANMANSITPEALRFERLLDAPIGKVWRYLTEPELRARWFMGGPTDLRVGGTLGLRMDHDRLSDGESPTPDRYRHYVGHSWEERITRCDPPRLLAFTWENGEAGEVTVELSEEGPKTRLILVHAGLRGRDDALDFGGGWHSHLAALERRIRDEGVADFWALHAEAERKVEQALG
jgi:uncharacterized protein YndB with AHSA1/START domain